MNINNKGISIIKATIILISICIIITIAVVTWTSGVTSIFMANEKIEIIDVWSKVGHLNDEEYFFISIDFKNVGNTIVRICNVYINGKPFKEFSPDIKLGLGNIKTGCYLDPMDEETFLPVKPGERGGIGIRFPLNAASLGQKIHITIYTVNGGEYHVSLILEE
jgi:archaellum component FlaF (FlaF/FlaG flagellin family)